MQFKHRLVLEWLECRTLLSATPIELAISPVPANVTGGTLLTADEVDTYSFTVTEAQGTGRVNLGLVGTSGSLIPRLTLAGPHGEVLVQSDSGRIVQHMIPGTYELAVSAQVGTGDYRLSTLFGVSSVPFAPLAAGASTFSVATGDFNRDGILDLVAPNRNADTLSIFLGNGDGTFPSQRVLGVGFFPVSATVADVNSDGNLDLLVANKRDANVGVLLGNGDGTFQSQRTFAVGARVGGVAVADFNGDGKPDFASSNYRAGTVSVLLGNNDGTFQPQQVFDVDAGPGPVQTADVNGDGRPDLVTPNYSGSNVSVLLGNGDGTFQAQRTVATGYSTYSVAIADVNGDGRPDLVACTYFDNNVSVLLGNGDGTFAPRQTFGTGALPYSVVLADVNGDGRFDVVTSNFGANSVSLLLGNGDGTFRSKQDVSVGKTPRIAVVGDMNGDGKPDIIAPNKGDNSVIVLLGKGDGTFFTQEAAPAPAPGIRPISVAIADFNSDGRADLVTANRADSTVSVLMGNANGSLQTRQTFPSGPNPNSVVVADFNGDGHSDVVVGNYTGRSVSVLLGNGDGTFLAPRSFAGGSTVFAIATADLNGDGKADVVSANKGDANVSVLLGNGDGTLRTQQPFATGAGVDAVTIGDVNLDGRPDVVVTNFGDHNVGVLLGNGDGTLRAQAVFNAVLNPAAVVIGDVNGDGRPDLVAANYSDSSVSVLLGNGDGTFAAQQRFSAGAVPNAIVARDFNGDGKLDVVTTNTNDNNATLLRGNGDGTFAAPLGLPAGSGPLALAASDINGDGKFDLAIANDNGGTVSVLHGNGDGTFQPQRVITPGKNRYSVAVADVNGDGKTDIVKSNLRQDTLSVQLGNGTGTFEEGQTMAVGSQPTSVRVADLNRDGRSDLVATNSSGDSVSVRLGNGDGTFNVEQTFGVGRSPRATSIADIDGDGVPDLLVANYNDGTVSLLLGRGDGSFGAQRTFGVGQRPYSLAVSDVNGDGRIDVVVSNTADDTVSVLLNRANANGTFRSLDSFGSLATGQQPIAVALNDINGDNLVDVVTANAFDHSVSVLLGNGDGSFRAATELTTGGQPASVAVADVNGDNRVDLVIASFSDNNASILLGNGDGTFQPMRTLVTNLSPTQTAITDINGDGRPDLVTVGNHDASIGVLLSKGSGEFRAASAATAVGLRDTPFLADLNGDGLADRIVLDRSGEILFRRGVSSSTFAPPVILNPGRPARDITLLRTESNLSIAAADARFDADLSTTEFVFTVSVYDVAVGGAVSRQIAFSTTALPSRLTTADVTGDGRADVIVANSLDNSISIAVRNSSGGFAAPIAVATGNAPSDLAVADANRDGQADVLVSNQASGDVSVVLNNAAHTFSQSLRFRVGTLPYGLVATTDGPQMSSLAETTSVAAGDFTGDGIDDMVVVNRGAHSFTILAGNGRGGFANPQDPLTTSTSEGFEINARPGEVVAGDFNRDGRLDLAVLMEDTGKLWIFSGRGGGTFDHTFSIPVGDQATGLSVIPGSSLGLLDLLVGNGFGDVLHLAGRGDGTFQIRGNRVSLSVVPDLFGPGQAGVLVGNQQDNRVTIQSPTSGGSGFSAVQTLGANNSSQLAPGEVQWAQLARNTNIPDAVVVSTGGNAVIVYHTVSVSNGVPVFSSTPRNYFVGTSPVSVTVADVNGDSIPDMLVANRGSNDVSLLFGKYAPDGEWMGIAGPRLRSGGAGPIAVSVRDLSGDLIPDLAVTNGSSGTITMLAGVGLGFFDDRRAQTLFNLGGAVDQPPTNAGESGVNFAVTVAGDLVRFDLSNPSRGANVVFSGSQLVAAQALSSGQVVVAVADGSVKILSPQGDRLIVSGELRTQAATPALPSSLVVLQQASGQFQVLVSSQGSDTVSVFASVSAGSPSTSLLIPSQVITNQSSGLGLPNSLLTISTLLSLNSLTDSLGGTTGLSLASFLSTNSLVFTTASAAALVTIEGNSYSTVAVLDFGSQQDDESGDGRGRRPELSTRFPFGSKSPLTRFVIGIEEAILDFRRFTDDAFLPEDGEIPLNDPWNEDLFQRRQPVRPPSSDSQQDPQTPSEPPKDGEELKQKQSRSGHESPAIEQAVFDLFWEESSNEDLWLTASLADRKRSHSESSVKLLASLLVGTSASVG